MLVGTHLVPQSLVLSDQILNRLLLDDVVLSEQVPFDNCGGV